MVLFGQVPALLALLAAGLVRHVTGSNITTCDAIAKSSTITVIRPDTTDYDKHQSEYWSKASGGQKPTCILEPRSAAEVSTIVKMLLTTNETFAIKSGGHNPNKNFSSVIGGPLISTAGLDDVELDATARTVRMGPGNRWDRVQNKLNGTGFTVVGGRMGNVGVGGYLLGGGLSFLSTQYGWAANNILEYELVSANGSVLKVTNTSDPDLFLSLKGGGNNFGIVTSYLVRAYPQGDTVWGGNLFFMSTRAKDAAMLAAVANMTMNYTDPKAGIIVTAERGGLGALDTWIVFLFYDGPDRPKYVFDAFFDAGPFMSTCGPGTYEALLGSDNHYVMHGSVYTIGTETTVLPPTPDAGLDVLSAIHTHWRNVSQTSVLVPGIVASIAYQPFPRLLAGLVANMGGDMYAMDASVDRVIFELDYSFWFDSDYPKVDKTMQDTYTGIRDIVTKFQDNGTLPAAHLPLFMNDGYWRQDIYGRMKPEKKELAKSVRARLDPDGLWMGRTGGFKVDMQKPVG